MDKGKDMDKELSGMLRGVPPQNIMISFDDKPVSANDKMKENAEEKM